VLAGDLLIVQVECQGDSFATGIDKATGEPRWRIPRPKDASWSSPVLLHGAKPSDTLVLLQSPKHLTAHRVDTGEQVWAYEVPCDAISSPAVLDGTVYVASKGVTAIKPGSGKEPEVVWNAQNLQPGAASVIASDGKLFIINRAGVLNCASAADGKVLWRTRLEGEFWGTPALAGNHLYAISQKGKGQVVEIAPDGKKGDVIGSGQFEGEVQSSPAVTDGALYIRSDGHLWKIAAP
jgi:outer membrane protein assembly factor BamB